MRAARDRSRRLLHTCNRSASSMRSRPIWPVASSRQMRLFEVVKVGTRSMPGALRALPRSSAMLHASRSSTSGSWHLKHCAAAEVSALLLPPPPPASAAFEQLPRHLWGPCMDACMLMFACLRLQAPAQSAHACAFIPAWRILPPAATVPIENHSRILSIPTQVECPVLATPL